MKRRRAKKYLFCCPSLGFGDLNLKLVDSWLSFKVAYHFFYRLLAPFRVLERSERAYAVISESFLNLFLCFGIYFILDIVSYDRESLS